jgi:DNA-binding response OmpR family regulator
MSVSKLEARPVVALFNASDDTMAMVQRMLDAAGFRCLVGCLSKFKSGAVAFAHYLAANEPEAVIFDVSLPYKENWDFVKRLREDKAMEGRGVVLTTPNKLRLDEAVGRDSEACEIVGKPYDLAQIKVAIDAALARAQALSPLHITRAHP